MSCKPIHHTNLPNIPLTSLKVTSEENSKYSIIIDRILKEGDLSTISAKQIRKDLQAELGFDLSHQKVMLFLQSHNFMVLTPVL